jgi:hypothetical protein
MQWHYHLLHLDFPKLKQLALNSMIFTKLAKVALPKCAGCLFGAMTKIPWHGKETKASHKVFVATKPGECALVDQMTSTEMRFYAQFKGKLTKKHYKCATIYMDHFSHLCFFHFEVDNSSLETAATKRTLEQYAAKHNVRIQHYNCNIGGFHNNAFQQVCHMGNRSSPFVM